MSLVESIAILSRKAKHRETRHVLGELHRLVGEGRAFSHALDGVPNAFGALFVATVRTSERTGNLAEALRRYLAHERQINGVRDKMLAAAVYPALLMLVGIVVIVFLMVYVVPRFSKVYEEVGEDKLPLLSLWLMHWGQLVGDHVALLVVSLLLILCG
jgi:general secretion pathway protein F